MNLLLAATLVFLAAGQMAALVAVLTRHAIPRAPGLFPSLLMAPMLGAFVAALLMAVMAADISPEGSRMLFGVPLDTYRLVFFACEAAWIWILNVYALAWHLSIRHRRGGS